MKRGIGKKASLLLLFLYSEFISKHCQLQILILLIELYWSCYWNTCFYSKNTGVQLSSFKAHDLLFVMETQVPSAFWLCWLGSGKLESKHEGCASASDTLSLPGPVPQAGAVPKHIQSTQRHSTQFQQPLKLTFSLYSLRIRCVRKREICASPKHQPEFAVIST